jgi:hypothetical protein
MSEAPARRGGRRGAVAVVEAPEPIRGELRTENIMPQGPTTAMETGRIIVPRSQREIDEIIERWRSYGPQPIAHDLECAPSPTVPNGTGLHPHLGTIRLAQFGIRDSEGGVPEAMVIDCWRHSPAGLVSLLADPDWETIIHFAQMESRWLGYEYGIRIENLFDTRLASKLAYDRLGFTSEPLPEDLQRLGHGDKPLPEGITPRGPRFALGMVGERELGVALDKEEHQFSYWDAVRLNKGQLKYAGEDVLVLLDLHERLAPLLTADDLEEMRFATDALNDRSVGVTAKEARKRNLALAKKAVRLWGSASTEEAEEYLKEHRVVECAPNDKNCESERVLRMVAACRTKRELDKVRASLPHMRIHFTNRQKVIDAIEARRSQIKRGTRKPVEVKATVPPWEKPF